jgi:hypothetical protein
MCWACEERDMLFLYELECAVEAGVIPEGFLPEDFEAAGLPVPGRDPKPPAVKAAPASKNAFTCDTPDGE